MQKLTTEGEWGSRRQTVALPGILGLEESERKRFSEEGKGAAQGERKVRKSDRKM